MNKDAYFDADFLSAFLTADDLSVVYVIFPDGRFIPEAVYDELIASRKPGFRETIDNVTSKKIIKKTDVNSSGEEMELYLKLTRHPDDGYTAIGRGEAAAITLAVIRGGILASNNLKDVIQYVRKYNLELVTTGQVIHQAVELDYISRDEACEMWDKMILHGCKLGAQTYDEYVKKEGWKIK